MHFFISGATGRNGTIAMQYALSRDHTVTILTRNPSAVVAHPNLTVVKGTPTSQADVEKALQTPRRPQAIISLINPRRTSENLFAPLAPESPVDLLEDTANILVAAVKAVFADKSESMPKLIINSSLGVGSSWSGLPLIFRFIFFISTMRLTIRDHDNMDKVIRASGLPFVLARPARLDDAAVSELKVLPDNGKGVGLSTAASRQAVGEWLVKAGEVNTWDGRAPVLVN